jgi:hypothetical protein
MQPKSKNSMVMMGPAPSMSSADAAGSAATGAPPAALAKAPPGVGLGFSLERLIYFNGRFLKAEDLTLEQRNELLRIALSERAQGAGVSYGYHVTTGTKGADPGYVSDVATQVYKKMIGDPSAWAKLIEWEAGVGGTKGIELTPAERADLIKRLAGALGDVCGGGGHTDAALTIGAGHAADGYGSDLYLPAARTIQLQALIDAFHANPTSCTTPAPSITPQPITTGVPQTGAFLLCLYLDFKDQGQVPVYGVQCNAADTACSLGYHEEGVGVQLVFFDALAGKSIADRSDPIQWRGAGARKYFEAESATHPSLLGQMTSSLPFSAGAAAPDSGSHVPIGVVYLDAGSFAGFDEWTAKRLREPAEMSYWLRALVHASRPARLARMLQFQAQLTEALAAWATGGGTSSPSLWQLGFADAAELVLPGVGFLPLPKVGQTIGGKLQVIDADLRASLDRYFQGVPYELVQASPGDIEAVFVGALESQELRLGRGSANFIAYTAQWNEMQAVDARITAALRVYADASPERAGNRDAVLADISKLFAARTKLGDALSNPPSTAGAPAVQVWYSPDDFPGWAMFTWPDLARSGAGCATEVCLCTDARATDVTQAVTHEQTFRGGEYAGFPLMALSAFRLRLDGQNPGLVLRYGGLDPQGQALSVDANGWVSVSSVASWMIGFWVRLEGAASSDYEVHYTARFFKLSDRQPIFIDGPTAVDGALCNLTAYLDPLEKTGHSPWSEFIKGAQFVLQSIRVSVVRKGCTANLVGGGIRLIGDVQFNAPGALAAGAAAPAAGAPAPAAGAGSPNR